jgi:hypothetical protein
MGCGDLDKTVEEVIQEKAFKVGDRVKSNGYIESWARFSGEATFKGYGNRSGDEDGKASVVRDDGTGGSGIDGSWEVNLLGIELVAPKAEELAVKPTLKVGDRVRHIHPEKGEWEFFPGLATIISLTSSFTDRIDVRRDDNHVIWHTYSSDVEKVIELVEEPTFKAGDRVKFTGTECCAFDGLATFMYMKGRMARIKRDDGVKGWPDGTYAVNPKSLVKVEETAKEPTEKTVEFHKGDIVVATEGEADYFPGTATFRKYGSASDKDLAVVERADGMGGGSSKGHWLIAPEFLKLAEPDKLRVGDRVHYSNITDGTIDEFDGTTIVIIRDDKKGWGPDNSHWHVNPSDLTRI